MKRHDRALIGLVGLVAVLLASERMLVHRAAERRAARSRVGRLIPKERLAERQVAALRIELPSGEDWLLGPKGGTWRVLDYHEAPADPEKVGGLLESLTEAEGMLRSEDPGEAAVFGVDSAHALRVSLCGDRVLKDPGRDVLFAFDIGHALPGREGAFVRLRGSREVWAIASNPRALLEERTAPGLPPLLEAGVVARGWEGWRGLERVTVRRPEGAFTLVKEPREVTPEEMQKGARPWTWVLDPERDGRVEASQEAAEAFVVFLHGIPYREVLDAGRREELLPGGARSAVELRGGEGASLALELGPPDPESGDVPVWNPAPGTLFRIAALDAERAAPARELLASGSAAFWNER